MVLLQIRTEIGTWATESGSLEQRGDVQRVHEADARS